MVFSNFLEADKEGYLAKHIMRLKASACASTLKVRP